MKKLVIGALLGAVGIVTGATIYTKGYEDGKKDAIGACKTLFEVCNDMLKSVKNKEEEA